MKIFEGKAQIASLGVSRPVTAKPSYFVVLDLGQSQDYSALCILERHGLSKDDHTFDCRHLPRWKLRTGYPEIIVDTGRMMNSDQLQSGLKRPLLAIDATGVGAPVIDLFKRERMRAKLEPIQITGGSEVTKKTARPASRNAIWCQSFKSHYKIKHSKIAPSSPDAETLIRELGNFKVKITDNAYDTYGAWREGTHDDLVLAVALALWAATKITPATFYSCDPPNSFYLQS
jgi:hypothetical protein